MSLVAPAPEEMTEEQIELWDDAYLRFRQRRMRHLKMIAVTAIVFVALVLPLTIWLGWNLWDSWESFFQDEPMPFKTYLVLWFLAAPFVVLIYLRARMRFDQGYQKTDLGEERYEFSYHHQGGDIAAYFRSIAEGTLNEITSSRSGCFVNLGALFIVAMFAGLLIYNPLLFYGSALVVAAFSSLKMLGWYLWLEPVEKMRSDIYKAKEQREAQMIHVRGAQVIEAPEASTASPVTKPPSD